MFLRSSQGIGNPLGIQGIHHVTSAFTSMMTDHENHEWKSQIEDDEQAVGWRGPSALILPQHLEEALKIQTARGRRAEFFDPYIFGEPGWDILLALYVAHARGYRMKVSDACFEARVPPTTALRWLEHVEKVGLVDRRENALDGRSSLVQLTSEGIRQMDEYISAVLKPSQN